MRWVTRDNPHDTNHSDAAGPNPLFVTKAGFEIADPKLLDGTRRVTPMVRGDTRFDVQLARR